MQRKEKEGEKDRFDKDKVSCWSHSITKSVDGNHEWRCFERTMRYVEFTLFV